MSTIITVFGEQYLKKAQYYRTHRVAHERERVRSVLGFLTSHSSRQAADNYVVIKNDEEEILVITLKYPEYFLLMFVLILNYTLPIKTTRVQYESSSPCFAFDVVVPLLVRHAFVMALFQQSCATSQHLFPSRVALIFGRDLVFRTGESNLSVKYCPAHPKDFQWG